jgi:hypothetical protein
MGEQFYSVKRGPHSCIILTGTRFMQTGADILLIGAGQVKQELAGLDHDTRG